MFGQVSPETYLPEGEGKLSVTIIYFSRIMYQNANTGQVNFTVKQVKLDVHLLKGQVIQIP